MSERKTRVVNCKSENYDVYIGRPSKWGNPFKIGKDGSRQEVILKFKNMIITNTELIKQIPVEIRGKTLGCWCTPDACHGDVLVELADKDQEYVVSQTK